ncbi:hypothetical protein [Marilutibacter maris]|uniref:hypothetical protein n=1 Tax=Marilutibacter maris TaxID=1605891 RepID=UPI0011AE3E17|nr:hypothetical protein [Lysobacter maris]
MFQLFDVPEQMGVCPCGFDPFDADTASTYMRRFPTLHARGWLEAYWRWAREQRTTRYLVAPEHDYRWRDLYRTQAAPPDAPPADRTYLEIDEFSARGRVEPTARECWAWCLLGSERPMTFVPLPGHMHAMLSDMTQRVVNGLPASVGTPLELVTFSGLGAKATLLDNVRARPDCFILPHSPARGAEIWLNLSAIEPELLQLCGRLIDCVIVACGFEPDCQARSLQAARSHALEQITGRECLVRSLECLILRGYAQGLNAVIRGHSRNRIPNDISWWLPSIEVRARPGHLDQVQIAWLQVATPKKR